MAHFRGILRGSRGEATRLGTKASGLRVEAQSWQGKLVVYLSYDAKSRKDVASVELERHFGEGASRLLWSGNVDGSHFGGRRLPLPSKADLTEAEQAHLLSISDRPEAR